MSTSIFNVLDYGAVGNGVADDSAALQACCNAAAGKGMAWIPGGYTFAVHSTTTLYGNDTLFIEGTILIANGTNAGIFLLGPNYANLHIFGKGTLNLNGANQTTINAYGLNTPQSTLAKNIVVEGISIVGAYYFTLYLFWCSNVRLRDLYIDGTGGSSRVGLLFSGYGANSCENCWIENCTVVNTGSEAIAFYGANRDCGVRGCYLSGGVYGVAILNDGGQTYPSSEISISNNSITGMTYPAIFIQTNSGGSGVHRNIVIEGNHIYSNPSNSMYLANCDGVVVANNICHDNGYGIYCQANGVTFVGNRIFNEKQANAAGGYGIYVSATSDTRLSFIGNAFYDTNAAGSTVMYYGIYGASTTDPAVMLSGNTYTNLISAPVQADTLAFRSTATTNYSVSMQSPNAGNPTLFGAVGALVGSTIAGTVLNAYNASAGGTFMAVDVSGNFGITGHGYQPGGGSWIALSDFRLKKDITPFTDGLTALSNLRVVRYKYNEVSGMNSDEEFVGLTAQEAQEAVPHLVRQLNVSHPSIEGPLLAVDPSNVLWMLVNAVKELQTSIVALTNGDQSPLARKSIPATKIETA